MIIKKGSIGNLNRAKPTPMVSNKNKPIIGNIFKNSHNISFLKNDRMRAKKEPVNTNNIHNNS